MIIADRPAARPSSSSCGRTGCAESEDRFRRAGGPVPPGGRTRSAEREDARSDSNRYGRAVFGLNWRPGARAGVIDSVPAALLALPVIADRATDRPFWPQAVILAGLVLPLIGRRRRPEAMTAIVLAAAWLGLLSDAWGAHLP